MGRSSRISLYLYTLALSRTTKVLLLIRSDMRTRKSATLPAVIFSVVMNLNVILNRLINPLNTMLPIAIISHFIIRKLLLIKDYQYSISNQQNNTITIPKLNISLHRSYSFAK